MTDYPTALAAAREALAKLREHDGGTRYNGDDDDAGARACCLVASWKPHDSDCPHAVAVADFENLIAAIDAARGPAVAWRVWRGDSYELFFNEDAAKRRCQCFFVPQRSPEPLYAAPPAAAVPAGYVPLAAAEALALEAMRIGNIAGHNRTVEGCWSEAVGFRFEEFMADEGEAILVPKVNK